LCLQLLLLHRLTSAVDIFHATTLLCVGKVLLRLVEDIGLLACTCCRLSISDSLDHRVRVCRRVLLQCPASMASGSERFEEMQQG
jgi:hypothetical protein